MPQHDEHDLEVYFRRLAEIRQSGAGVKEESYYDALSNLLNSIGSQLKPRVHCILQLINRGAGHPDGGLFSDEQVRTADLQRPLAGQVPARGAIEVKSTSDDAWVTADTKQVTQYLQHYGQVLVTNYRDFVLVGKDKKGQPVKLESYRTAVDEIEFWNQAAHARTFAQSCAVSFGEFLRRVMLHSAQLASPRDVAWFLASYARTAKSRMEGKDLPALTTVRSTLEEALGVKFVDAKGERFFRSTFIQTLFYGVFSAWVLWSKGHPANSEEQFRWQDTAWFLQVPIVQKLFYMMSEPTALRSLDLVEVLDWTANVLNRVSRPDFFAAFEEGLAVQYFYEPFLEAFDPDLRKELGVWYTPPEVVKYMVAKVDTALREELGVDNGLANPNVYVLDPCCGTGSYLVEVLRRIHQTLKEQRDDALVGEAVKRAAVSRIFGFEILPAPFVVAHLQIGLLLQSFGASLSVPEHQRAGVYLTNALTGWEPLDSEKEKAFQGILAGFPELLEERDSAKKVKQQVPILVILGNPPYNGVAGMAVDEERELSEAYKKANKTRQPQGQGLNDLYVRFFRMAERRIVEQTGEGVICYISNYSWLDHLSFPAMREQYLDVFDSIWIDCLNGDKYKTGKLTPDGQPDPSIFSTEWRREGIQVGTAIATLVRKQTHVGVQKVLFRHLWGTDKLETLLRTPNSAANSLYEETPLIAEFGLPFFPIESASNYLSWPLIPELFPQSYPGVVTSRDDVVVGIDQQVLVERMEKYFDVEFPHDSMRRIAPSAMQSTAQFDAEKVRDTLRKRGFLPENIMRYSYRPFDGRWLYWEPETKLLDRNRAEFYSQISEGNVFLFTTSRIRKGVAEPPWYTDLLTDYNCMDSGARGFPLYIKPKSGTLFEAIDEGKLAPNLTENASNYLISVGMDERSLFLHVLGILQSEEYRRENENALSYDWPRIPLPNTREALEISAALGTQVTEFLDTEHDVVGVTSGSIRSELRIIGVVDKENGGQLQPSELKLMEGWGYGGQNKIVMPGKGKVLERDYTPEERTAIATGGEKLGLSPEEALECLGERTFDVYLNDIAYWRNIPKNVWEYVIGGHQVIKKWLSYREFAILGRPLAVEEALYVTNIARRLGAVLLLQNELNRNYKTCKADTYQLSE